MGAQKQNGQTGTETGKITRTKIIKLIERVNQSKRRVREGLLPLTYKDDGWRVILPTSLEFYEFLPSGRELLSLSIYDYDMKGGYYWIPYSPPPRGVTTPAIRLMAMGGGE